VQNKQKRRITTAAGALPVPVTGQIVPARFSAGNALLPVHSPPFDWMNERTLSEERQSGTLVLLLHPFLLYQRAAILHVRYTRTLTHISTKSTRRGMVSAVRGPDQSHPPTAPEGRRGRAVSRDLHLLRRTIRSVLSVGSPTSSTACLPSSCFFVSPPNSVVGLRTSPHIPAENSDDPRGDRSREPARLGRALRAGVASRCPGSSSGWLRAAVGFGDGGGAALRDRAAAR
jgi:hypothetical protein